MIRTLLILPLVLSTLVVIAQSRIRVGLGVSTNTGGSMATYFASSPSTLFAEIEYEKRLAGSISLVTGANLFGVGYITEESSFGSGSKFSANYVGVPLMMRFNFGNKNLICVDFGVQPYYLVDAQLEESITKFGSPRTYSGNITDYSNRLYVGLRFQGLYMINRVMFGISITSPFSGQTTISTLSSHWPLNQQQSTYLGSNGYSDFFIATLKVSYRIK